MSMFGLTLDPSPRLFLDLYITYANLEGFGKTAFVKSWMTAMLYTYTLSTFFAWYSSIIGTSWRVYVRFTYNTLKLCIKLWKSTYKMLKLCNRLMRLTYEMLNSCDKLVRFTFNYSYHAMLVRFTCNYATSWWDLHVKYSYYATKWWDLHTKYLIMQQVGEIHIQNTQIMQQVGKIHIQNTQIMQHICEIHIQKHKNYATSWWDLHVKYS